MTFLDLARRIRETKAREAEMTANTIDNIETRRSADSDDWKPVFLFAYGDIEPRYARQYLEINRELGWDKYRIVYRSVN